MDFRFSIADFRLPITEQANRSARMEALPGAQAVSAASNTPLNNRPNPSDELIIEGRARLSGQGRSDDSAELRVSLMAASCQLAAVSGEIELEDKLAALSHVQSRW
jgi:hypothetical protein